MALPEIDYFEYATDGAAQAAYVTDASLTPITVVLQPVGASGIDNMMISNTPDTCCGGGTSTLIYAGIDSADTEYTTLIKFDVSSISSDATVTACVLSLYVYGIQDASKDTMEVNRVLRDWGEGTVTWNKYDGTNAWTTAGAKSDNNDIDPDEEATCTNPTNSQFNDFTFSDLTSIQGFIDGDLDNYGWRVFNPDAVKDSTDDNVNMYSSDKNSSTYCPKLTVTYTLPTQKDLQVYSEDTIVTQGSYSLKAIAVQTDSLNDTLTRTVDPPIDLSGINTLKVWAYASRTGTNISIAIHDSGGTTTTKNIAITSANTWTEVAIDVSGVSDANKDAIVSIIATVINADAANTFYLDNFRNPNVAIEPSVLAGAFALSSASILLDSAYTPSLVTMAGAYPAPDITLGVGVAPSALSLALAQQESIISCGLTCYPTALSLTSALFDPTLVLTFPLDPSYIYTEEIGHLTKVLTMESGTEQRNSYGTAHRAFDLNFDRITETKKDTIVNFYDGMYGRYGNFNWVNPNDSVTYNVRFVPESLEIEEVDYQMYNIKVQLLEII